MCSAKYQDRNREIKNVPVFTPYRISNFVDESSLRHQLKVAEDYWKMRIYSVYLWCSALLARRTVIMDTESVISTSVENTVAYIVNV